MAAVVCSCISANKSEKLLLSPFLIQYMTGKMEIRFLGRSRYSDNHLF